MTDILLYGIVGDSWDRLDAKTLVPMIADSDDDLNVYINSPGGYVMEGLAIFNALNRAKADGRKVTTIIDGLAASMASVLAMVGDEIIMADNALIMIHNPWDVAIGDAAELRRAADKLDTIRDQLVKIYAAKTGMETDELVAMLDAETWLTSEQALEMNFVTKVAEAVSAAACDISAFGFRKAPDHPHLAPSMAAALRSVTGGKAMRGVSSAVAAALSLKPKETTMPEGTQPATEPSVVAITTADVHSAVTAERDRVSMIRALGTKHNMPTEFVDDLVAKGTSLADARAAMLDKLAEIGDAANIGHSPARVTQDARDKFVEGATNWLLVKSGVSDMVVAAAKAKGETIKIDPGEFRGVRNTDLAREALNLSGINVSARDPEIVVREAMTTRSAITQTTSDFPVLFENAVHRILQAAYTVTPDTWSRFCGTGTVTDFRPHTRYLRGSFGALDTVNEAGEFKNKPIPDLAKELIKATTKGNIINLSRQAIVNDDMDVFSGLAVDLGRAAKLTIEIDVYALLNSNPVMNDGVALFHATHGNLAGVGAAPSMAAFDAIGVAMASQKDVSGNEILEIEPTTLLIPRSLRGLALSINGSEYDPDTANKLQKPNIVKNMFSDIIGTARLSGTAYYAFADPNVAPAIEVVFLNGVTEPFTDSQDGWRVDGVEWKVRHDYGVGAVNYRSAYKQPGA
ncbi:ATP-dependent Clp protease proteolytic subunit [Sphingomonas sp. DBB INV C78]|uniref:ClpP-like prohead protease/major capsid protein fusion protein n=1 Tax=Sphingomonas sp. DBB INV C78 TaxID=3349434 RepID=UPI0036D30A3B